MGRGEGRGKGSSELNKAASGAHREDRDGFEIPARERGGIRAAPARPRSSFSRVLREPPGEREERAWGPNSNPS